MGNTENWHTSRKKSNAEPRTGSKKKDNTVASIPLWLNNSHTHSGCNHIVATLEFDEREQKIIDRINDSVKSAMRLIFENIGVYSFIQSYQNALFDLLDLGISENFTSTISNAETIKDSIRLNSWYWSASKSLAIMSELNELASISDSFKTFEQSVGNLIDRFNKKYLLTEYQLVQQASVELTKHIQRVENAETFPYVRWKQIDRKNKRPEHIALDGMVFDVKKVPLIPPIGWNCGCRLIEEETLKGKLSTKTDFENALKNANINSKGESEWDRMSKYGFDVNRYEKQIIFSDKQFYGSKSEAIKFVKENDIKMP